MIVLAVVYQLRFIRVTPITKTSPNNIKRHVTTSISSIRLISIGRKYGQFCQHFRPVRGAVGHLVVVVGQHIAQLCVVEAVVGGAASKTVLLSSAEPMLALGPKPSSRCSTRASWKAWDVRMRITSSEAKDSCRTAPLKVWRMTLDNPEACCLEGKEQEQ